MADFDGVFVGGTPLEKFLEDAERDKKSYQIERVRKEGEKRKKFTIVYADEKQRPDDTRKVAKRVRRFTNREIRKEYGIMAKPFKTHAENAIWTIMEKGPINAKEIGREIEHGGAHNTLSAMLATIWTRLGNKHQEAAGILTRESQAGTYFYEKIRGVDISVEAAIEKYKIIGSKQYRIKLETDKAIASAKTIKNNIERTLKSKDKAEKNNRPVDYADQENQTRVFSLAAETEVNAMIDKVLAEHSLLIEVKVSGQVNIVFGFQGFK